MKTAIVYYSFSGNTHRVAQTAEDILKKRGEEVIPVRIRPLKEEKAFLKQCKEAFFGKKPELYTTLLDLGDFDKVILGSPVWAFKPAPAINTYLDKCGTLVGKEAICFVTYGSGTGKDKAIEIMKKGLETKGARVSGKIFIQQAEKREEIKRKLLEVL